MPAFDIARFDPFSPRHVAQMIALFENYMVEEYRRTRSAPPGLPAAHYLKSLTLWSGDTMIGFCSLDLPRRAVELIYIDPTHRRLGIARSLFEDLQAHCPEPMRAKVPLSPAGQALVDSVGIGLSSPDDYETEDARRANAEFHQALAKACHHRRGNPARACSRCYTTTMRAGAKAVVTNYAVECQLLASGLAVLVA